jgi:hypothetical protein
MIFLESAGTTFQFMLRYGLGRRSASKKALLSQAELSNPMSTKTELYSDEENQELRHAA